MKSQSLYRELAKYYDSIYHWKNYEAETAIIYDLIARYNKSRGNDLLEAGCGSGHHLQYFKKDFMCTGLDINQGILSVAKKKNKGIAFINASMIDFNLHKQFDVITCLFSAIGYVKTKTALEQTIQNFAAHLKPGGVLIIEPWFSKSAYKAGTPHLQTYADDNLKIARLTVSEKKGSLSIMDMHYLVAEKNKEVKHFIDRHELGLFESADTLRYMKEAGLQAKFLKKGLMKDRGLFIGVKK